MLLKLAWDAIDWEVIVHEVEEASLDLIEQLVSLLANEPIVVLALHVHHEFLVARLSAL